MGELLVTSQKLRFCDTDMLGHVNNAAYAEMFEAGRVEMLAPLGLLGGPHAVVIVRLEIDFRHEMNWPGDVTIETWITRVGTKSLHMGQRLLVEGAETARSRSVLAVIDVQTRRAVPLTDEWRAVLARWQVADDNVP
jgi:acyl-CoA thioester hydrolase